MATGKSGRPTNNPKNYMLRARIDNETLAILDECCKITQLSRSEIVRISIVDYHKKIKK